MEKIRICDYWDIKMTAYGHRRSYLTSLTVDYLLDEYKMPGSTSTSTATATDYNSTKSETNTNYTRITPISNA